MAYRRSGMSRKHSKSDFRRKSAAHPMNYRTAPMRGGIRL